MQSIPGRRLTPRDRDILQVIRKFEHVDRLQLQERFFGTTLGARKQANKRLKFLTDAGYLHRAKQLLVQGQGDRPRLYTLTMEAAHELGDTKRRREYERGGSVLEHRRLINSLLLKIETAAEANNWEATTDSEQTLRDELAGLNVPYPDGRFYLTAGSGSANCGLIEADRGTESKKKFSAKVTDYLEARRNGRLHKVHGAAKLRVLVVTTARLSPLAFDHVPELDERRVTELLRYIASVAPDSRSQLVWVTTVDAYLTSDPLTSPIWRTAGRPDFQSLI